MAGLVLGGYDVVGDDDDDVEGSGLVLGRAGRRRRLGHKRRVKVPTPKWMRGTTTQGVSRPEEEMDFLPFDALTIPIAGTTGVLIGRPQRPFRGERLIMGAVSAGVNFAFGVVIDPAIFVGAVQVGSSQGSTPISAFGADAFGVRLSVPPAGQGTEVKIFVRALVPAVAAIAVTATIIGRAMR